MIKTIKFSIMAIGMTAMISCSSELDRLPINSTYTVDVPVDVNKVTTRAVIDEEAITVANANTATWEVYASNGTSCAKITGATYDETSYTAQPWVDDPNCMYALGTNPTMTTANSYYETKVGGTYSVNTTNGTIVATAATDGNYLKPMSVAFYGIYAANVSATAKTGSITNGSAAYEGGSEKIDYKLSWTNTDKKAQYTVAGFAPTFTVADNITVKTGKNTTSTVSATQYPFTIQYIYVGSSKSVVYGTDYNYTPGESGVTKLGLPQGGVFAGTTLKTVGGFQDYVWSSFTTNQTTFMTLLPTKSDEVEVTLCCWNCGTKTIYTKSGESIRPGSWFYIQGTLKKGTTVSNSTNPDCEAAGVTGVFMPDVVTKVTINITTIANCETNVTPEAGFTTSFIGDVIYGGMTGSYTEK